MAQKKVYGKGKDSYKQIAACAVPRYSIPKKENHGQGYHAHVEESIGGERTKRTNYCITHDGENILLYLHNAGKDKASLEYGKRVVLKYIDQEILDHIARMKKDKMTTAPLERIVVMPLRKK